MRKKRYGIARLAVLSLSVLLVLGTALAAMADTIYNSIDNTVDATHEVMNLTYPGSAGSTTLSIQVDGHPDHPGCNIQGGPHYVGVAAASSNPGIVSLSWSGGDSTFNTCSDVLTIVVTPLAVGSTTITFSTDASNTSNDPNLGFSYAEATFDVNVTDGTSGGSECDADPAAPAWAAAILQKSGYKPKASNFSNWISAVAQHMTNGAAFEGWAKNRHPEYENSVHDWLQNLTGKTLASAQSSARPGWVCTAI